MSKYTSQVRFICETYAGYSDSKGYNDVDDVINKSWQKIFDFNFPIFDDNYKEPLCKKILMNFYTQEIGEETVALWKLRLRQTLNRIMPYYNQLYNSELLKFDPLNDVDYTRTLKGTQTGQTDRTNTRDSSQFTTNEEHRTGETNVNRNGNRTANGTDNTQRDITDNLQREQTDNGTSETKTKGSTENQNTRTITNKDTTDTNGSLSTNRTENRTTDINKSTGDWDLYSDTPQGGLGGFPSDPSWPGGANTTYDDNSYLTNVRHKTGAEVDHNTDNNEINGTDTTTGKTTVDTSGSVGDSGTVTVDDTVNGTNQNIMTGSDDRTVMDINARTTQELVTNDETETGNTTGQTTSTAHNSLKDDTKGTTNINNLEDYVVHVYGKMGQRNFSLLLDDFRKTFLNIDDMILNELRPLFFMLWA